MQGRSKKFPRKKNQTDEFLDGSFDDDESQRHESFGDRDKNQQQRKTERTARLRSTGAAAEDIETLPVGQVVQVHSLFYQVEHETGNRLCVARKTLSKLADTAIVVGDLVRFRDAITDEVKALAELKALEQGQVLTEGQRQAVIEQVLPRRTVLTRADSFTGLGAQPIVANAEQMLIVVAVAQPRPKWGLIDRMLVAAQAGGLVPIICLNKTDVEGRKPAEETLDYYQSLGIACLRTSIPGGEGLDRLAESLRDKTTVLAGHSGVGKSSLIGAIQPGLDLRVGEVSRATDKGRHTTTSARRYRLDIGGQVIDTPGVKLFGLYGVQPKNLSEYFPDIQSGTAPEWRQKSYERIARSLRG
jgi:ribosome biogenesis GTPase / thiamine phosphate phosphatase